MISHFFCHDADGRIVSSGQCPTSMLALQQPIPGTTLREGVARTESDYWNGNDVVEIPLRPSAHHVWDWTTKQWNPDLADAITSRKHDVDAERARRSVLPVTYNSAPFDADDLARERISGTLARLLRGDGLPSGWLGWRDADNNMHWVADTPAAVQTSLAGLSSEIEDREQVLLIAAWTHKHLIGQLTTVESILAYDVNTGWP